MPPRRGQIGLEYHRSAGRPKFNPAHTPHDLNSMCGERSIDFFTVAVYSSLALRIVLRHETSARFHSLPNIHIHKL